MSVPTTVKRKKPKLLKRAEEAVENIALGFLESKMGDLLSL